MRIFFISLIIYFFLWEMAISGTGKINGGRPVNLNLNLYYAYKEEDPDSFKELFQKASALLYRATDKKIKLGKIKVYKREIGKRKADIWIIKDKDEPGRAHKEGLGRLGRHIFISQRHNSTKGDIIGQFGLVHNLGHYAFNLKDEYYLKINGEKIKNKNIHCRKEGENCIMDGGSTIISKNKSEKFCNSHDHHKINEQERVHNISCLEYLISYIRERYKIDLNENIKEESIDPEEIEWRIVDDIRYIICIDKSGSMRGKRMELAKKAGKLFIDLIEEGDSLSVVSFNWYGTVDFPLSRVNKNAKKEAKERINRIYADGGTNIGNGLSVSLSQLLGYNEDEGEEIVLLISDGHSSYPYIVEEFKRRGVKVYSIGVGNGVDKDLLNRIARETKGSFGYAERDERLISVTTRFFVEINGGNIYKEYEYTLKDGEEIEGEVYVDYFIDEITYILDWEKGEFGLTIQPPENNSIEKVLGDNYQYFKVLDPSIGIWRWKVKAKNIQKEKFNLKILVKSRELEFTVLSDKEYYNYDEPIILNATVVGSLPVVGAKVEARVIRPDNSIINIDLYDDGNKEKNGDEYPNDGVYSAKFNEYSGRGVYKFEVMVNNLNGWQMEPDEEVVEEEIENIPQFKRVAFLTLMVEEPPNTPSEPNNPPNTNTPPKINITSPKKPLIQGGEITIIWEDSDPDDNAIIYLYWDSDKDISNNIPSTLGKRWGRINRSPIYEDPDDQDKDSFSFNPAKIIPTWCSWSRYFYVLATIDDCHNPMEHDYNISSSSISSSQPINKSASYSYSPKISIISYKDKEAFAKSIKDAKIVIPPNTLSSNFIITIDAEKEDNIIREANIKLTLKENLNLLSKSIHTFKLRRVDNGEFVNKTHKYFKIYLPCREDISNSLKSKDLDNLKLFFLDRIKREWILVEKQSLDKKRRYISAKVNRLTTYTLIEIYNEKNNRITHYPNPLRYNHNSYGNRIYFKNIPQNERIRIYNRAGELIRILDKDCRFWNLRNDYGELVSSDIYFYVVKRPKEKPFVGKIMVIK